MRRSRPQGMSGRPSSRPLHQPLGGGPARDRAFLLPRPPLPGHLGAVLVAAAAQGVAVAGQQGAGRDQVVRMPRAGEPQPHGSAVSGEPETSHGRLVEAAGGTQQVALDNATAPTRHYVKRRHRNPPDKRRRSPGGSGQAGHCNAVSARASSAREGDVAVEVDTSGIWARADPADVDFGCRRGIPATHGCPARVTRQQRLWLTAVRGWTRSGHPPSPARSCAGSAPRGRRSSSGAGRSARPRVDRR